MNDSVDRPEVPVSEVAEAAAPITAEMPVVETPQQLEVPQQGVTEPKSANDAILDDLK